MTATIIEVVAALIVENGKFLICRRPEHKARAGLYEFVGGKVEKGETKEEALVREVREELGVEISVGELFCSVRHDYPDISICLSLYKAQIVKGEPQLLEHSDMRFIAPDEIPSYDFCPADIDILKKLAISTL